VPQGDSGTTGIVYNTQITGVVVKLPRMSSYLTSANRVFSLENLEVIDDALFDLTHVGFQLARLGEATFLLYKNGTQVATEQDLITHYEKILNINISAYERLIETISLLNERGYHWEPSARNILADFDNDEFNVVDVNSFGSNSLHQIIEALIDYEKYWYLYTGNSRLRDLHRKIALKLLAAARTSALPLYRGHFDLHARKRFNASLQLAKELLEYEQYLDNRTDGKVSSPLGEENGQDMGSVKPFSENSIRLIRSELEEVQRLAILLRANNYPTIAAYGSARENKAVIKKEFQLIAEIFSQSPEIYNVITGGGPGVMHAANKGHSLGRVRRNSQNGDGYDRSQSLGLVITLPFEEKPNLYLDHMATFKYFFTRILGFAELSQLVEVYLGGAGTFHELFAFLLLKDRGLVDTPIVLVGHEPIYEVISKMARRGLTYQPVDKLITFVDREGKTNEEIRQEIYQIRRNYFNSDEFMKKWTGRGEYRLDVEGIINEFIHARESFAGLGPAIGVLGTGRMLEKGHMEEQATIKEMLKANLAFGYSLITRGGPITAIAQEALQEVNNPATRVIVVGQTNGNGSVLNNIHNDHNLKIIKFTKSLVRETAMINYSGHGFLMFEPGIGTMHAFFTLMDLIQTKKVDKDGVIRPILLLRSSVWEMVDRFIRHVLIAQEVVDVKIFQYYRLVDSVTQAQEILADFRNQRHRDNEASSPLGGHEGLFSDLGSVKPISDDSLRLICFELENVQRVVQQIRANNDPTILVFGSTREEGEALQKEMRLVRNTVSSCPEILLEYRRQRNGKNGAPPQRASSGVRLTPLQKILASVRISPSYVDPSMRIIETGLYSVDHLQTLSFQPVEDAVREMLLSDQPTVYPYTDSGRTIYTYSDRHGWPWIVNEAGHLIFLLHPDIWNDFSEVVSQRIVSDRWLFVHSSMRQYSSALPRDIVDHVHKLAWGSREQTADVRLKIVRSLEKLVMDLSEEFTRALGYATGQDYVEVYPSDEIRLEAYKSFFKQRGIVVETIRTPGSQGHATRNSSSAIKKIPVMLSISLMDVGAELDHNGKVVYRDSLKKLTEIIPYFSTIGIQSIYIYGGLYQIGVPSNTGSISEQVHQLDSTHSQLLRNHEITVEVQGYDTKYQKVEGFALMRDYYGNSFSVKDMRILNPRLSQGDVDLDFEVFLRTARDHDVEVVADFIPWMAPDGITSANLHWSIHRPLSEEEQNFSIHELLLRNSLFAAHESVVDGKRKITLVKHLHDWGKNVDQVFLNAFHPEVQQYYIDSLKRQIDRGIKKVRIDLAHKVLKNNLLNQVFESHRYYDSPEPWEVVWSAARQYADHKNTTIAFILETYTPEDRETFTRLSQKVGVQIELYFGDVHKDYHKVVNGQPAHYLSGGLNYALQLKDQEQKLLIYPSNYDEFPLKEFGGPATGLMELIIVLAHLGVPVMIDLREWLGHLGHMITIPGGKDPKTGVISHKFVTPEEFHARNSWEKLTGLIQNTSWPKLFKQLRCVDENASIHVMDFMQLDDRNDFIAIGWKTKKKLGIFVFNGRNLEGSRQIWVKVPEEWLKISGYKMKKYFSVDFKRGIESRLITFDLKTNPSGDLSTHLAMKSKALDQSSNELARMYRAQENNYGWAAHLLEDYRNYYSRTQEGRDFFLRLLNQLEKINRNFEDGIRWIRLQVDTASSSIMACPMNFEFNVWRQGLNIDSIERAQREWGRLNNYMQGMRGRFLPI
ncbi:MAG: LOG family protein, partial [Candidatus Omnitrophica bacterium]|nr:LOG family protein [Candidatus Omnitrophota bacterium]